MRALTHAHGFDSEAPEIDPRMPAPPSLVHPAVTALASAAPRAAEQQTLDIDGTVFVSLGLFLILFGLLSHFLWKPYLRVRHERTHRVDGYREEATRMEADAQARLARIEAELTETRRQLSGELSVARAEARAREQTMLAQANAEAQATLEDARRRLEAAMAAERARLSTLAGELGRQAASRVLGRSLS